MLVPAQRGPRNASPRALAAPVAVLAIAPAPKAVLAIEAAPGAAAAASADAQPTAGPSTAHDASPWFDWRRARGSTDPPGAEPDASAEEQSDQPDAEAAAAAGPRAFPWFRSIEG